jgi:signal transduction histidine kinase/DNA-binding response OmpR family regulator
MKNFHYSSKLILTSGFAIVVLVITALTITWAIHVFESKENIEVIFGEQKQSRLLVAMRDAARQRAIYLHRMITLNDPFERDEEFMKFNNAATDFVIARNELLGMEKDASQEVSIWNKARPFIVNGQASQLETAELILQDRPAEANELLLNKVIPIQNKVNETLSEMFGVQKDTALKAYDAAIARNERIYWIAILSGSSAVLLTVFVAFIVVRRTIHAEASLDEARVAAQTATEMKSQFLANMSHEIRTPLTAVIGYADTMLEHNISEEDRNHTAKRILNNGKHLLHIINDILDISKIEAGQLSIEKISISQFKMIKDVEWLIGSAIREEGLGFEVDYQFPLPDKIKTDPTRLKQILLNLLGNAKKFTPSGSVSLTVRYLEQSKQMCYEVNDTGIGMTLEEQAKLFKAFTQADESTTREFGGTGLGLYISRQLAHMLGGDLICHSAKGQGSQFIVTIDAELSDDACFVSSLDRSISLHEMKNRDHVPALEGKVLLAEDNPDNQRLISMYINNTGATVVVVNNGEEAVEHAVMHSYDLILMDMQMPVMGGAEAVQWLRDAGNQVPIAMLTANAMKEEKDRCLKLGANDFLTKPIDKHSFYSILENYLHKAKEKRQIDTSDEQVKMDMLAKDFISSLATHVKSIRQCQKNSDWETIKSILHQLKGMGTSFGFPKITELSVSIERNLRENNLKQSINELSQLLMYMDYIALNSDESNDKQQYGV